MKSNIMPTYNRKPVSFVKGEGVYLYDNKGNKYFCNCNCSNNCNDFVLFFIKGKFGTRRKLIII